MNRNTNNIKATKYLLFFQAVLVVFVTGCDQNSDKETARLSGKFINESFLKQISDSIPGLIPVYCYQLDFNGSDSVNILYGFEQAKLAYKKAGNKYQLSKALQDKDMTFVLNKDKSITLIDSAWNGTANNSVFKESETNFVTALNQQMIAGDYHIFKDGKKTSEKVTFYADGKVAGLEKFTNYTLCYSGDCVGEIYPISNSITLGNANLENTMYAFKIEKAKNTLGIYHIEAPVKDIKGERAIQGLAFDLRK